MNYKIFMFLITPAHLWIHLMGMLCNIGVQQQSFEQDEFGDFHKMDD